MVGGHVGVPWTRRVGAFLAIGTSPGALVLGAGIAMRNDGTLPLLALLVGAAAMSAMLYGQGLLGLVPPTGEGGTLAQTATGYLGPRTLPLLHGLLAFAMVGWFGFNVGLGGAALAAVTGLPAPVGPFLLATPIVLVLVVGRGRWNGLAVVTTLAALALVGLVAVRSTAGTASDVPWVTLTGGSTLGWLGDVGAFIGFVSVFSLRAPDFTQGLASRRDLRLCVATLVACTIAVVLAGAALARVTGTIDVVAAISGGSASAVGNLLVATAVVGASFASSHSGALALQALFPIGRAAGVVAIAVPGTVLAVVRFDRYLVPWLELLAVLLPPLMVPLVVESTHRRRGGEPRRVTAASWVPGAVVGAAAGAFGSSLAPLLGLAVAAVSTAVARRSGRS